MVTGTESKQVVIRGLGPTLAQHGVSGALADPFLSLFDGSNNVLWNNNDWKDSQQTQIQATGLAPPNDLESAILRTLQPGNYTAILSGRNGTTGIGLIEVYDVARGALAELTNVSTRGFVGTDDNVLIAGFIAGGGNRSTQVVVRGLGPTLGQQRFTVPECWQIRSLACVMETAISFGTTMIGKTRSRRKFRRLAWRRRMISSPLS